jgi:hypothetical protein
MHLFDHNFDHDYYFELPRERGAGRPIEWADSVTGASLTLYSQFSLL